MDLDIVTSLSQMYTFKHASNTNKWDQHTAVITRWKFAFPAQHTQIFFFVFSVWKDRQSTLFHSLQGCFASGCQAMICPVLFEGSTKAINDYDTIIYIVFSLGCALRNLQMTEGRIELVVGSLQADTNDDSESLLSLTSLHDVLSHSFPD